MISDSYNAGYVSALMRVQLGLHKEAAAPDFFKKLFLAGAVTGGGMAGGVKAGTMAMEHMSAPAQKAAAQLVANRQRAGKFVDVSDFMSKWSPGSGRARPEDLARFPVERRKNHGEIPKSAKTDTIVKEWLGSPMYKAFDAGTDSMYTPGLGLISGSKGDPSVLAHEVLGHGSQKKTIDEIDDINSFGSTFLGKQKNFEQDAWTRARKSGFPVDDAVEDASMNTYKKRFAGAVGGGVAGAGAGAGGTGAGLMGIAALLEKLKKSGRKKR